MTQERRPTSIGAKRCAEWLRFCREQGWAAEQLPKLCDLWWEHHDDNGALIERAADHADAEQVKP